jgi:hypothetical protein
VGIKIRGRAMICRYEYKNNILFEIFPETLSDNDFHSLNDELESIEKKYSDVPERIVNLKNLKSYNGNFNSIYEFVQKRKEIESSQNVVSAFLVSNDFQMQYARMFQILMDTPPVAHKIFVDEAKAVEYVKSEDTNLTQRSKQQGKNLFSYH